MTDPPRETRVLNAMVSLVDSLLDDFDVVELLTERSTRLLDVEATGLLLADPQHNLHLMAAISKRSRELELFQLQADEGPCLDCYAHGQPVAVADLTHHRDRWPRFVPAATAAGYASVHAVPMRAAGAVPAMGLFGTHTGDLDDADLRVAQALAQVACVAILQDHAPTPENVLPQLRRALASRIVVEQAKGYLRERFDVTVEDAFTMLRRHARSHGQHLTVVARDLISDRAARRDILSAMQTAGAPTPHL